MSVPTFIETNPETIIAEVIAKFEELSGRTLQPSQSERLMINTLAYREILVREQIQHAGAQMLIDFSTAPAIDYLAALVGVTRLSSSSASTTIRFTLVAGHNGVVIPANTRVATSDGQIVFATQQATTVASAVTTADVISFAQSPGAAGNDYAIGEVNDILDPQAFIVSASNTTATSGGTDQESDDELRARVKLAPSQFSTAGPVDAYKFHTFKASPTIVDVGVLSSVPGTVNVYPLVEGGVVTPPETIALVVAALNDEKVRPLSDTVVVASPTIINYAIEVELTIYESADSATVQSEKETALQGYADEKQALIGQDITLAQITSLSVGDGSTVYNVNIVSPVADVVVANTEVAVMTSLTVTVIGTTSG